MLDNTQHARVSRCPASSTVLAVPMTPHDYMCFGTTGKVGMLSGCLQATSNWRRYALILNARLVGAVLSIFADPPRTAVTRDRAELLHPCCPESLSMICC